METLNPEVLEDLRNGRSTRERKLAVCAGGAHLNPADRVEILTILAHDPDQMVSARAQEALLSQPVESFVEAVSRGSACSALFAYLAKNLADRPGIGDAMAQNQNCAAEFLVPVARHLSTLGIRALLDQLDRVSGSPSLAAALEHSSHLTEEQRNQLRELRSSSLDHAALAEAVAEAEPDLAKRQTLLQRLAVMSVAQRVQFAIKGDAEARRTLIRDSSKVVQRAVLQSPRLTEQEVETFAAMSNISDEILRLIANNRNFRKNYTIVRNLLNNAKTPLDVSLHLLPLSNAMDLKRLCLNKNIAETLRSTAIKLQRQRQEAGKK